MKIKFEKLESMARQRGIVCERNGRKIELTTPDGGVMAECDTVADAADTIRQDTSFNRLPIVPENLPERKCCSIVNKATTWHAGKPHKIADHVRDERGGEQHCAEQK